MNTLKILIPTSYPNLEKTALVASTATAAVLENEPIPDDQLLLVYNLVAKEYLESAKILINISKQIPFEMIETDFRVLDYIFLEHNRSMYRKLMDYFDKGAWAAVLEILNKHQEHATCPVCLQLCLENCICCDVCSYWYHFECYDATPYHKSGNVKNGLAPNTVLSA